MALSRPSPLHRATDAFTRLYGAADMLLTATTPERVEAAIAFLREVHTRSGADFRGAMDQAHIDLVEAAE